MISTRAQYDEVLALLKARDTRRNPHRLPVEQYSLSEGEFFFTICARHHGQPFTNHTLAMRIIDALRPRENESRSSIAFYVFGSIEITR